MARTTEPLYRQRPSTRPARCATDCRHLSAGLNGGRRMSLVELKQLSVGYDRPLLYIEQAQLKPGDRVALTGANASPTAELLHA